MIRILYEYNFSPLAGIKRTSLSNKFNKAYFSWKHTFHLNELFVVFDDWDKLNSESITCEPGAHVEIFHYILLDELRLRVGNVKIDSTINHGIIRWFIWPGLAQRQRPHNRELGSAVTDDKAPRGTCRMCSSRRWEIMAAVGTWGDQLGQCP